MTTPCPVTPPSVTVSPPDVRVASSFSTTDRSTGSGLNRIKYLHPFPVPTLPHWSEEVC